MESRPVLMTRRLPRGARSYAGRGGARLAFIYLCAASRADLYRQLPTAGGYVVSWRFLCRGGLADRGTSLPSRSFPGAAGVLLHVVWHQRTRGGQVYSETSGLEDGVSGRGLGPTIFQTID